MQVTDGASEIAAQVAGVLADEANGLDGGGELIAFDVAALWQGGPAFEGRTRSNLVAGLGVVGGATVGIEMLGMLGTLLGAAVVGPASSASPRCSAASRCSTSAAGSWPIAASRPARS